MPSPSFSFSILVQRPLQLLHYFLLDLSHVVILSALREGLHFHGVLHLLLVNPVQVHGEEDSNFDETDETQSDEQAEDATKVGCRERVGGSR